jgi:hypothetical protein
MKEVGERLLVLLLVLKDEAEDVGVAQERVSFVKPTPPQMPRGALPHAP